MSDSPPSLTRLRDLGFERAGRVEPRHASISIAIDDPAVQCASPVLYAFVVADEVMYVGKTAQTFGGRMQSYCTPGPTQRTNLRVRDLLLEVIAGGQAVTLWVWRDPGTASHRGLVLDSAAGLESAVIRHLQPPWNGGKRGLGTSSAQIGAPASHADSSAGLVPAPAPTPSRGPRPHRVGTHAHRILALLASLASTASERPQGAPRAIGWCDDCVADRASIVPRQTVNITARKLEADGLLLREKQRCPRCGGTKICNRLA
ncbi:MAG: GIY-YIG nuclease family protein [Phycisphaerae bacterium]|nr:GIY-YIG nuclease family protein [Phycisphaerae bacterium]